MRKRLSKKKSKAFTEMKEMFCMLTVGVFLNNFDQNSSNDRTMINIFTACKFHYKEKSSIQILELWWNVYSSVYGCLQLNLDEKWGEWLDEHIW